MDEHKWLDDSEPVTLEDVEKAVRDSTQEIVAEITGLRGDLEEHGLWRFLIAVLLALILWRVWH